MCYMLKEHTILFRRKAAWRCSCLGRVLKEGSSEQRVLTQCGNGRCPAGQMEDGHSDKDKGKALKGLRTVNCLLWYLAIEPGRRERGEARDRDRQGGSK